jgi:ribosomal protein S18 acetylase RimI-like enzyme
MTLRYSAAPPDAAAFKALYDTTGWGPVERPAGFYAEALAGSWRMCCAYDGEALVGFGRIISDGRLHAFITEMIIHPGRQQRGIGSTILRELVAACQAAGISDIQLFCAEGKEAFYRQGGFAPRAASRPGMQYEGGPA